MNADTLPQFDSDIIIVGAGPAGATAAFYLAKSGVKVLLFDRQTFPRDKVCGDFVGPLAIKELEAMGVTERSEFKNTNIITKAAVFLDVQELLVSGMPQFDGIINDGRVIP